jgi:hypothetical protein
MLGTDAIYEVVTGQILLSRREEFFRLHREVLLPMLLDVGIEPVILLVTEVGRLSRFVDIYRYPSLVEYGRRTDRLLTEPAMETYYAQVAECIHGSITIELAQPFPHFHGPAAAG